MNNKKPIRVAQIMGKWVGGGLEAVIMNYYRNIDREKIQFDFIFDMDSNGIPYEEIERLRGRVIIVPPYQKIIKYYKELKRILKNGNYEIVHSHLNTLSVFSLYAAKKANVPIRIAHNHSTTNKKEWKKNLLKTILKPFVKLVATNYMACTEHAGRWMFGDKEYDKGNVYLLNNAIEINDFLYNENERMTVRRELQIVDKFVIGHIGRFVEQKNHKFLIDIFNEIHRQNSNAILLLIGQGPLLDKIKKRVKELKLDKFVLFLGQRNDVNELYQAMDLFLFPSLYEGLGMVMVEAQCSGLPCIASSEVPTVAKVNDNVDFIDLNQPIEIWAEAIKERMKTDRLVDVNKIKESGYDITIESKKLENEYFKLLKQLYEKKKGK